MLNKLLKQPAMLFAGMCWSFASTTAGSTDVEYKWIQKADGGSNADEAIWEPDPYRNKSTYSGSGAMMEILVSHWGGIKHSVTTVTGEHRLITLIYCL
jgi:hypothetical protein